MSTFGFNPRTARMDRYEDCDRCGERYWNEDIKRYLRDEGTQRVCCSKETRR